MKIFYTRFPKAATFAVISMLIVLISGSGYIVQALPSLADLDQDPGLIISDQDFYSLPFSFSTPQKIQQFLVMKGSFLANLSFVVSFVPDSAVLNTQAFAGRPVQFSSPAQLGPYLGKTMSAADIIWSLSRTNMSSSCSIFFQKNGTPLTTDICYDGAANPINPGFIISLIQKESGLIYGTKSKLNPASVEAQDLLDRVTGYYCFEIPKNPTDAQMATSCFDQNPDWKYYKGFFRQLYFATRLLRLREQMCRVGGSNAFTTSNGVFKVGSYVTISNRQILLKNGISCAMYIYTPHFDAQVLALRIMRELEIDRNLIEIIGVPADYIPAKIYTFGPDNASDSQTIITE